VEGSKEGARTAATGNSRALAIVLLAEQAAGTASAIEVFHQVPALAPGVVEAMPLAVPQGEAAGAVQGRAVREALPVWEAPEAAGGGEGNHLSRENDMRIRKSKILTAMTLTTGLALVLSSALAALSQAAPQSTQKTSGTANATPQAFATPQEAATTLIQAAESFNVTALKQILGSDGEDLVSSEDAVRDKNIAAAFAAKAREKNEVTLDPKNSKRAVLSVGNDDWPLPIPLVKRGEKWSFDAKAGREEILFRRIGANELDAIQICRGYVEAQHEYAQEKHDNSEVNQYAQRIISAPGKHDGLAWQNPDGSWGGPVGEGIAKVIQQGYSNKSQPYHGYYFKVLKGQGPAAPLGQMDFVVNGAMIGGFALAAAPAEYRVTGVKTFIVSHEGVVYQKDLGPNTLNVFKTMELYNPDKTWVSTDDNW